MAAHVGDSLNILDFSFLLVKWELGEDGDKGPFYLEYVYGLGGKKRE